MQGVGRGAAAVAALVVGFLVPVSVGATETYPGDNGRLAYTRYSGRGCGPRIATMEPDGSDYREVTPPDRCEVEYPIFSPDGRRILFASVGSLESVAPDGTQHEVLRRFDGFVSARPVWSPDGSKIAFSRFVGNTEIDHIYTMDADGSDLAEVAQRPYTKWFDAAELSWSPDGTQILFVKDFNRLRKRGSDLFIAEADGGGVRRITRSRRYERAPDWSPDGTTVVFAARSEIFTRSIAGGGGRRLTETRYREEANPVYSPDGSHIAFQSTRRYRICSRVAVIDPDGSRRTRLTTRSMSAYDPVWSPDSTELAFTVEEPHLSSPDVPARHSDVGCGHPADGVYVVEVSTGDIRNVFEDYLLYNDLDWGPRSLLP